MTGLVELFIKRGRECNGGGSGGCVSDVEGHIALRCVVLRCVALPLVEGSAGAILVTTSVAWAELRLHRC